MGFQGSIAALVGAYAPILATRSELADLGRFSQLLEETEHLRGCGQEKGAKIVHCGEAKGGYHQ